MRKAMIGKAAYLLVALVVGAAPLLAQNAPSSPNAVAMPLRPELAVGYTYVHSNAPPGGCSCFNLNGGSASFAWPIASSRFAAVGDVTAVYAGAVSANNFSLTLSAYTAGVRYLPRLNRWPVQPFGQVLLGMAHSSGSLVQGQYSMATNAAAAFAANAGGGLDLPLKGRISLRLIEADYLLTTIDNGSNNHQNNLRISGGVVLHF